MFIFLSTFYHLSLSGLLRITIMSGSCQTWESDQNKLFAAFINLWSFNKVSFPASVSNITKHGRFRFSSSLFLKIQEICMHMIACWIILKVLQESRTQLISWDVMWEKDTICFLFLFLWFSVHETFFCLEAKVEFNKFTSSENKRNLLGNVLEA